MSVTYNTPTISDRLQAVIDNIDGGGGNGNLKLYTATSTLLSTISLARPCGTIDSGVLTFVGTLLDPSAAATGTAVTARIEDSTGVVVISGLTVGIPLSASDVIMSNGLNSTLITAGQATQLLSAQITGS